MTHTILNTRAMAIDLMVASVMGEGAGAAPPDAWPSALALIAADIASIRGCRARRDRHKPQKVLSCASLSYTAPPRHMPQKKKQVAPPPKANQKKRKAIDDEWPEGMEEAIGIGSCALRFITMYPLFYAILRMNHKAEASCDLLLTAGCGSLQSDNDARSA